MYKYKQSILIAALLLGIVNSSTAQYDSSDFSAEGRKLQPVPTGHTPGKDNGSGFGFHSAGEDCGICHKPGGRAPNNVFSMSGTLYEDRAARKPLKGGEVILQDVNGKVISMTSNEAGNFWTYEAIGGNPLTVVGKSTVYKMYSTDAQGNVVKNADTTYPQTWQYKTWVKNGDHVLPMVTIAPVGGSSFLSDGTPDPNSRMSCSMHHSPMGSRGGLWASTKSTLSSYPATGLSFKKHILPIFRNKCVPCHIPGETWTRIVTKTDIESPGTRVEYSAGIDLSSYSGSTVTTKDSNPGYQTCQAGSNCTNNFNNTSTTYIKKGASDSSVRSLLLSKTDGTIGHAGGKFWSSTDADYIAIKQWMAEGAQNN